MLVYWRAYPCNSGHWHGFCSGSVSARSLCAVHGYRTKSPTKYNPVCFTGKPKNYVLFLWFEIYPKEKFKPKPKLAKILRKYEYLGNTDMLNCKWLLTKCLSNSASFNMVDMEQEVIIYCLNEMSLSFFLLKI